MMAASKLAGIVTVENDPTRRQRLQVNKRPIGEAYSHI